jgi:hypothetical protein
MAVQHERACFYNTQASLSEAYPLRASQQGSEREQRCRTRDDAGKARRERERSVKIIREREGTDGCFIVGSGSYLSSSSSCCYSLSACFRARLLLCRDLELIFLSFSCPDPLPLSSSFLSIVVGDSDRKCKCSCSCDIVSIVRTTKLMPMPLGGEVLLPISQAAMRYKG